MDIKKILLAWKLSYRVNIIPINPYQNSRCLFSETQKATLKFIWSLRVPDHPKQSWRRKTKLKESNFSISKLKVVVINTVCNNMVISIGIRTDLKLTEFRSKLSHKIDFQQRCQHSSVDKEEYRNSWIWQYKIRNLKPYLIADIKH